MARIKIHRTKVKPTTYAKRDRHCVLVDLDKRTEATKEYLAKGQCGKEQNKKRE